MRLLFLTPVLLVACGGKEASLPSTQVAAKVGSEEISVHQLNAAVAQSGTRGATPEQTQILTRTTLEGLIDQQVAVDQAVATKLNRDPDVIAQVEAARRAVLAGAYVKSFIVGVPKPDEAEAKKYYLEHPALFSERRIFNVQEIVAARTPEVQTQLETMSAANRSMDDMAAWLRANSISFKPSNATRAAEQIPLELLPKLHALKDGQMTMFASPEFVTVLRLVSSQTVPVSEALALPRIVQFLATQRITDAVTAQIKTLRTKAEVVYMGEFANTAPLASLAPPAAAPVSAAPVSTSPASAAPATAQQPAASSALEKGVAGLK
jgi:EpsD family peptidyl-prolyl cis-trans isomerase